MGVVSTVQTVLVYSLCGCGFCCTDSIGVQLNVGVVSAVETVLVYS